MALYELTNDTLDEVNQTTFAEQSISERGDIQRLLRERIDAVAPDTLIIAEEFGEFEQSKRRIDLLGIEQAWHEADKDLDPVNGPGRSYDQWRVHRVAPNRGVLLPASVSTRP